MDNTEIISNCNKEELMEIINAARDNLNDYKQSTDSEILQALINGNISLGEEFMRHQLFPSKHQFGAMRMPIDQLVRLPNAVSQIITKQQNRS